VSTVTSLETSALPKLQGVLYYQFLLPVTYGTQCWRNHATVGRTSTYFSCVYWITKCYR